MNEELLVKLLAVLSQSGEVVSKFFKLVPPIGGRDATRRLAEFLERFSDLAARTPLGQVE